jgi:hypothetical protein
MVTAAPHAALGEECWTTSCNVPGWRTPNTGELLEVNEDGMFTVIAEGLNQPTSLELIGNTAIVVTLTGEIWKIDNVSSPPYRVSR